MGRNNSNRFHLAIEAGDLDMTVPWYTNVLGCSLDMKEEGRWQDINFWGNELTLHQSDEQLVGVRHDVDMGNVSVPHFGAHLSEVEFQALKARIEASDVEYLDPPYRRFVGDKFEQETFFIRDPSGNALEIKTMKVPESLWEINS